MPAHEGVSEQLRHNYISRLHKDATEKFRKRRRIRMKVWEDRATQAGLIYIQEFTSGLTRRKHGKGFRYFDADGNLLKCPITKKRVVELVIPPAWTDVWICTDDNGHVLGEGERSWLTRSCIGVTPSKGLQPYLLLEQPSDMKYTDENRERLAGHPDFRSRRNADFRTKTF